jgi:ADP-heptose:LPS heptosyltransferase
VRPELAWLAQLWVPAEQVHALRSLVSDRHREGWPRPWAIVREARRAGARIGRPDLLIDLTSTPAAALFVRVLRPRFAIGAGSRRFAAGGFDSWRPMQDFSGHLAARPWWVLEPIYRSRETWPSPAGMTAPRLPIDAGIERMADAPPGPPRAEDEGGVLLFPGAGWPQKRWPLARFVELGLQLASEGHPVALLFAPGEEAMAEAASGGIAPTGSRARRISAGVTAGPQMLRALRGARAVVSNDSGAAHLAAALGLPTLAIFGPTNPASCGPLGPRVGLLRCDRPDSLGSVSVATAHEALEQLLGLGATDAQPSPGPSADP